MHVAVIGAGIGGLAASVRLAVAGCDVTVIEAATAPGGKLRQALIEGRSVDVGPTVLTMRDVFDDIFFAAGERLDDHLTLTPSETIARHVFPGGAVLDLFADPARSQAAVEAFSGTRSRDEFAAFSVKAKDVHDTLAPIFMRAERPTGPLALVARAGVSGLPALMRIGAQRTYWQALQAQFSDPRLRQLFGRYATYNGSSPFLAPATLMLIAHVEAAGVYLVEGGMHRLATAMAGLAERCGVEFRYGAPVAEIETGSGGVTGVRLVDGERIAADRVLSNCDAGALADGRFGAAAQAAVEAPLARDERSLSALTIAMLADTSGLDLLHHNVFFSDDYTHEFNQVLSERRLPDDPTVYLCAADRDGSGRLTVDGPERLFVIVNAPADGTCPNPAWSGGDRAGDAGTERTSTNLSQHEVDQCVKAVFSRLRASGLQVAVRSGSMRLSTPSDFATSFPGTGGALYGRASHGPMASFRRPAARTRLNGLYLCGGSAHPGAGLPMAALSGKLAADAILADRVSTSRSPRAATPGGMSTRFRPTEGSA